jgi:HSP20 family molecular chaperone IbpA
VFVLLAVLVYSRYGGAVYRAEAAHDPGPPVVQHAAPALRTTPATATLVPLRVGAPQLPCDVRPQWREQGVRDVEWDKLPPSPGLDMIQTDRGYVVAFSLPRVRDEDIRIDCVRGSLDIRAVVRDADGKAQGQAFRRIRLPVDSVADSELQRAFSNGVLRVFIPRTPQP